jgi:hypothetical protein
MEMSDGRIERDDQMLELLDGAEFLEEPVLTPKSDLLCCFCELRTELLGEEL